MKLFPFLWIICLLANSYTAPGQAQHGYRITFIDKAGSGDFSNPLALLSQRAVDRRSDQGISLDSTDLPVSPAYVEGVITLTGGKVHLKSRWFNYCVILVGDPADIQPLQNQSFITSVDYVAYYPAPLHSSLPRTKNSKFADELKTVADSRNKPSGDPQYYGHAWGQTHTVNGDYLHDRGYMGEGILIAVCDEGFEYVDMNPGFDSLRQSGRLLETYNFARANNNSYVQGTHGTASLSTMAGFIPGRYVGSAPKASYALYNTEFPDEQPIELDNLVAAIERADSIGADIITVSLGYNFFSNPVPSGFTYNEVDGHTTLVARAANLATSKGVLFVASAGNEGANGSWPHVLTPGDADSAITVGSVDMNQNPAGNSGKGPNASGVIKPDVCMVGQPAIIMDYSDQPRGANGTSFATPQLAGWAACLMQATSTYTPGRIKDAIVKSASLYDNPTHPQLGYGVPDFGLAIELLDIKDTPSVPLGGAVLYPNPVTDAIHINLGPGKEGQVQITIVDVSGRLVYKADKAITTGVRTLTIPAGGLAPGMYFLKLIGAGGEQHIKLLKSPY